MENFELIQKLQPYLGQKTTFKKIANKIGMSSKILADKMIQLETEGKLKFLALGNGIIRIGEYVVSPPAIEILYFFCSFCKILLTLFNHLEFDNFLFNAKDKK